MKRYILNKKGSISVVGVIITIIIVTVISGYISILNSSWVYNEVQSIMDLCSTNTLQQSIDSEVLRKEILGVKEFRSDSSGNDTKITDTGVGHVNNQKITSILKNMYQAELNKNVRTNNMIQKIQLVSFDADLTYNSWGATYNNKAKNRPQLRLDAVTQITLKANSKFDASNNYSIKYFNAKNNGNINIQVSDITGDGRVILTVRTLSRVLYK